MNMQHILGLGLLALMFMSQYVLSGKAMSEPVAQIVDIELQSNGDVLLNGDEVALVQLANMLERNTLHTVTYAFINIEPETPMGVVNEFIAELRLAGLAGISYEPFVEGEKVEFFKLVL